jgi:hypothetical protein
MVSNILSVYALSTAEEKADGLIWYNQAHAWASSAAAAYGVSIDKVAQVIAALSPLTPWDRNLFLAAYALEQWADGLPAKLPTLSMNWQRARDVLDGKDLAWQPKTEAFWHLIADPNDDAGWVCIDSHAIGIALNLGAGTYKVGSKSYQQVAEAYRIAADSVGLLPQHLQAITWVARHRLLLG